MLFSPAGTADKYLANIWYGMKTAYRLGSLSPHPNLFRLVAQKEEACTRLDLGVWGVGCGAVSSVGIERGINLSLPEVS